ncbi:unnamed protein product [Sphenostylis stenocarpa]|uniref:Translation initiation factor 3 C-terminal domain-containing protein n=1 Tax=Sphenostylis stenocarpa TaxID=92480 RepID=A0AA86VXZ1_9FABA|nr:unnamed protein product [Sphenostylis stenocarpa]
MGILSDSAALQFAAIFFSASLPLRLSISRSKNLPPLDPILAFHSYTLLISYVHDQDSVLGSQALTRAVTAIAVHELWFRLGFSYAQYNIDDHDYSVRLRAAQKFLKDGDKVKVIVNLKGRENEFRNIAIGLITRFQNDVGEIGLEEAKNFRDRNIFIILVPNKAAVQKTREPPKKRDKSAKDEVSASVQTSKGSIP